MNKFITILFLFSFAMFAEDNIDSKYLLTEIENLVNTKKLTEAKALCEKIRANSEGKKISYMKASLFLGDILINQGEYKKAYEVYLDISSKNFSTIINIKSYKKMVYSAIMAGDFKQAKEVLKLENRPTDGYPTDITDFNFLEVFLTLKEGKNIEEGINFYDRVSKEEYNESYIAYKTASFLAKYLSDKKDKKVLKYYQDSYDFAETANQKQFAIGNLINKSFDLEEYESAINYIDHYNQIAGYSFYSTFLKFKKAQILMSKLSKKNQAIRVYEEILFDKKNKLNLRVNSAIELRNYYFEKKVLEPVLAKSKFIIENSTIPQEIEKSRLMTIEIYYIKKEFDKAFSYINEINYNHSDSKIEYLYHYQNILLQLKKYDEALTTVRELIVEDKNFKYYIELQFKEALLLQFLNKKDEAVKLFLIFAKENPTDPWTAEALFYIGDYYFINNETQKALDYFNQLIEKFPGSKYIANALYKNTFLLLIQNKPQNAIELANILVEKHYETEFSKDVLFHISDYFYNQKENKKAIEILDIIIAKHKVFLEIVAKALYDKIYILREENRIEEVLKICENIEKEYENTSSFSDSLFIKGDILSNKADYKNAIIAYKKALKRKPVGDFKLACLGRLGVCYYSIATQTNLKEDFDLAKDFFMQIKNRKNCPPNILIQTIYRLAQLSKTNKDFDNAIKIYVELINKYKTYLENDVFINKIWLIKTKKDLIFLLEKEETDENMKKLIGYLETIKSFNVLSVEECDSKINELRKKRSLIENNAKKELLK